METKRTLNVEASVKARLLNLSKKRGVDMNLILIQFGIERFLYRLSKSKYHEKFVLKGAMLFVLWETLPNRPTRDVDFLGFGLNDAGQLKNIFKEICTLEVEEDGLKFSPESIEASIIKKDDAYKGVRIKLQAYLGRARIPIQADIGYGDSVYPSPKEVKYPSLLNFEEPTLKVYSIHTVIAEKFQAMVELGISTSRMKDFYDIWYLGKNMPLEKDTLLIAIEKTFERRGTDIPQDSELIFLDEFLTNEQKLSQWNGFLKRNSLVSSTPSFDEVISCVKNLLTPYIKKLNSGKNPKESESQGVSV